MTGDLAPDSAVECGSGYFNSISTSIPYAGICAEYIVSEHSEWQHQEKADYLLLSVSPEQ